MMSRLARALWIEIITVTATSTFDKSRLARALWIEIAMSKPFLIPSWSRLARALWIEIGLRNRNTEKLDSRGSREPCGLKSEGRRGISANLSRGSREPCGLK